MRSLHEDMLLTVKASVPPRGGGSTALLSALDKIQGTTGLVTQAFFFEEVLNPTRLKVGLEVALARFPLFSGRLVTQVRHDAVHKKLFMMMRPLRPLLLVVWTC